MNRMQLRAGLLILLLGVLVYLTGRPADSIPIILGPFNVFQAIPDNWVPVVNSLPSFAHTAAFILLTTALLDSRPSSAAVVCICWLLLEAAFEVGQHRAVSASFAAAVPAWWEKLPGFQGTQDYFLRGSFDPLDLLSIGLGALAAYFVVMAEYRRKRNEHRERT